MTPILMYHMKTLQAFWVNTQNAADEIMMEDPMFSDVEFTDPHYQTVAAMAGASDFLA